MGRHARGGRHADGRRLHRDPRDARGPREDPEPRLPAHRGAGLGWAAHGRVEARPLAALLQSERGSKAQRMALGIGADADQAVLAAFLHDPEAKVFRADEARQIRRFFRFVTMSVAARSRSANPNAASKTPPTRTGTVSIRSPARRCAGPPTSRPGAQSGCLVCARAMTAGTLAVVADGMGSRPAAREGRARRGRGRPRRVAHLVGLLAGRQRRGSRPARRGALAAEARQSSPPDAARRPACCARSASTAPAWSCSSATASRWGILTAGACSSPRRRARGLRHDDAGPRRSPRAARLDHRAAARALPARCGAGPRRATASPTISLPERRAAFVRWIVDEIAASPSRFEAARQSAPRLARPPSPR